MSVLCEPFGLTKNGTSLHLYTIRRGDFSVSLTDLGAAIVRFIAPDREGRASDVVLGFDDGAAYLDNPDYFGAVIGPSANRTADGLVVIDGRTYHLPCNIDGGNLHTDADEGLHKQHWQADTQEHGVTFSFTAADMMWGLPGKREFRVTYMLSEDGALTVAYHMDSDRRTLCNLTNHSYFNLTGHGDADGKKEMPTVMNHTLQMPCTQFTPMKEGLFVSGKIRDVSGTPFDFTSPHVVGERIDGDDPQLLYGAGYDHNFVIPGEGGILRPCATLCDPASGRIMHVSTTLPGVHLYAGNFIHEQPGKYGTRYGRRTALCLETQYFPDSVNQEAFASPLFGEDSPYDAVTVFRFTTDRT